MKGQHLKLGIYWLKPKKANEVGVTVDFGSKNNKAENGETAHWYGPDLERYTACIAVKRVKVSQTHDVIAKEIVQIYAQFRITKKGVVLYITITCIFQVIFSLFRVDI